MGARTFHRRRSRGPAEARPAADPRGARTPAHRAEQRSPAVGVLRAGQRDAGLLASERARTRDADAQSAALPGGAGARARARPGRAARLGEGTADRPGAPTRRAGRPDIPRREHALHELSRRRAARGRRAAAGGVVRRLHCGARGCRRARRRLQRACRALTHVARPHERGVGLLGAWPRHRSHPRARCNRGPAAAVARRAAAHGDRLLSDHAPVELELT